MNFLDYVSNAKFLVFDTILYYILGLLFIYKIETRRYVTKNNNRIVNGILPIVSVFIFFSFCDGDNFHYIKWFYYANHGGEIDDTSPQEPIYQLLSYCLNGNYFAFRILIWGSAIILFSLTSKRLQISPRVSLICLYCLFLFIFSYARASLGMCIFFYGYSYFIRPIYNRKAISYLIAIIWVLISVFFHTSMTILILLSIPTLVFPSFKDTRFGIFKNIIFIFLLITFIVLAIFIIEDYIESLGIPILSTKFSRYTNMEEESKGIISLVIESMISVIMILCLLFTRCSIYKCRGNNFILDKLFFISITLFVIGLTLSFLGPGYAIMSYRIKYMAIIPITLFVAYCVNHGFLSYRKFVFLECCGVLITLFRMTFYFYLTTKGLGIDLSQSY